MYVNVGERKAMYERGATYAAQALQLRETLADAHFYYAANRGQVARLKGVMASTLIIEDLQKHVDRALQLQRDHAPALHMKGMLLEELPWFLGGDSQEALRYLSRAAASGYDVCPCSP